MRRLEDCSESTRKEIREVLRYLDNPDISPADREAAERGLNDWFCENLMEEFEWKPKPQQ